MKVNITRQYKNNIELIEQILNESLMMTNDINSYLYLRTEGQSALNKYKLGGGNFISLLGLFSMLSMLAKIYVILKKGIDLSDNSKLFEEFKQQLKKQDLYTKYKQFVRKPRIDEVNETESFAELVTDYPNDLGLNDKSKKELEQIWENYRNKLTHVVRLAKDNCAMTQLISFCKYDEVIGNLPRGTAFSETPNKDELRYNILNNIRKAKGDVDISTAIDIIRHTSEKCYVDHLNAELPKIKNWIISELKIGKFSEDNIKQLVDWVKYCEII